MAYIFYNPNKDKHIGDSVVCAISKAMGCTWETAYISLCAEGMDLRDMPSANHVINNYLLKNGFHQRLISSDRPACVSVEQFAEDHQQGTYVVFTDNHVVAVQDGDYYNYFDNGYETILYYFVKEADNV